MPSPVNVALLGYGLAGRVFHAPLLGAVPQMKLRVVCSSRIAEIAALAPDIGAVADPAEIWADKTIDLVVIATPGNTHAALAEQAILAGKHVVIDKPVALTLADARHLAALAQAGGTGLFAFHNRRWNSDFLSVRAALCEGRIGRVTHFESHFDRFRPQTRHRWREDGSAGSGVWFDLGPHLVDQALLLFGRPVAVTADLAALRDGSHAPDWAHVILHYDQHRVVLHASLNSPDGGSGGHPRFRVCGTTGTLVKRLLDPQEAQLTAGLRPGDVGWGVDPDPLELHRDGQPVMRISAATGCQQRFYEMVAACLLATPAQPGPPPILPAEILAVQEVLSAAITSSQQRQTIALPPG